MTDRGDPAAFGRVAEDGSVYVRTAAGFEAREIKLVAFTESAAVVEGLEPDTEVALINPNQTGAAKPPATPAGARL